MDAQKWKHIRRMIYRPGPFMDSDEASGKAVEELLDNAKILWAGLDYSVTRGHRLRVAGGAGGLGCEILKNLALSGLKDLHVIDMDIIDVSNLNRQFLFREADVGRSKAEVAAQFVEKRVRGVKITPYCGKIQDKDEEYYQQFNIVVCGLDNVEARRWINTTLVSMVDPDRADTLKPLIDGGTEGFKGQAKVILPTMTACIECQLDMHAPRPAVPLCTLATIPRQPQHCIEWAHIIAWEQERKDDSLDTDDPEHIMWLYHKALKRAEEFKISGVTYSMTQGVVKNIIPAIASTNAIIAASCCNEALKIATNMNPFLGIPEKNNYMMYSGDDGIYTYTFEYMKKDDCPVCGNLAKSIEINPESTLQEFLENLAERPEAQLKKPTIRTESKSLYYQAPPALEEQTRHNLTKRMKDLISNGEEVAVADPAFSIDFKFRLNFI